MSDRAALNLASRPFRNERLPGLLFGLLLVGLAALSVRHAVLVAHLLPARTAARHSEVAALEKDAGDLRRQAAELRRPDPDKRTLARWLAVKDLVDRRVFGWTTLLSRLEAAVPPGVKLVSISPAWEKGGVRLDLRAVARSSEPGFAFVKALEDRPEFADVFPLGKEPREAGFDFAYTMRYLPQAAAGAPPAKPAGAEAPEAGSDEAEELP